MCLRSEIARKKISDSFPLNHSARAGRKSPLSHVGFLSDGLFFSPLPWQVTEVTELTVVAFLPGGIKIEFREMFDYKSGPLRALKRQQVMNPSP